MEQRISMFEIERNIIEFNELIKDQIDSIEVLWGLKGLNGRLGLTHHENMTMSMWSIARKHDMEEYPEFYSDIFKIIITKKADRELSARVETDLRHLGYYTFREINKRVPNLLKNREKLGLEYVQMSGDWFEFKTKEDLIDLFRLIEHSPNISSVLRF